MGLEERIPSDAERREEDEAFLKHLEKAREMADNWPEWKKRSGLRFWPNGAAPAETEEPEGESKSNGEIKPE